MQYKNIITSFLILVIILFIKNDAETQPLIPPPHIATDIKAERIKFSNNSIKITWVMDKQYPGEFMIGRSEKEITSAEETLQAKLIATYKSGQDGIFIDRDIQQGKKYFYIIIAKDYLLKRKIDIIKDVNYTTEPVSIYIEPEPVQSLRVDVNDENKILLNWKKVKGNTFKYNVYRSRSPISSPGELEVAEKIGETDKSEFEDTSIPDYGTYFYAITKTDKNGIEYFDPKIDQNFSSNGIFIKGKNLTTPLNVGAFAGDKNSIIIKWEKSESRTGKKLNGYEIYRSDEIINSLLKLKFAKLIQIVDSDTIIYTDKDLNPGKYYYAVFSRYNDGTVDINFDADSNYTKIPLLITLQYKINALNHEVADKKIILRWSYTGNIGNEIVNIFKSSAIPADSKSITSDDIIGTENIKAGKFTITSPPPGNFYYGVLLRNDNEPVQISKGINITVNSIENGADVIIEKKEKQEKPPEEKKPLKKEEPIIQESGLDDIIQDTYYQGDYALALKELKKFIKTTDNKYDKSKAKLFIAKTYIELNEYDKCIKILNSDDDIRKNFPEETKFWIEYALVRLN